MLSYLPNGNFTAAHDDLLRVEPNVIECVNPLWADTGSAPEKSIIIES